MRRPQADWPTWAILLGLWTLVQLLANIIDWVSDRWQRGLLTKLHFQIQADGFNHLFRLPLAFHKKSHINGVLQKISQTSWRLTSIVRTVSNILPDLLSVVIGLILAASINLPLSLILVVGTALYVVLMIKILLPIAELDSRAHRVWNNSWDQAAAAVQQIESVKTAAAENFETKKVADNLLTEAHDLWYRIEKYWNNVGSLQRIIVFGTQLAIFVFSVQFVARGEITIGDLVALNAYARMFFGPFVQLGYNWQVVQNGIILAAQSVN